MSFIIMYNYVQLSLTYTYYSLGVYYISFCKFWFKNDIYRLDTATC